MSSGFDEVTSVHNRVSGDRYSMDIDTDTDRFATDFTAHPLDDEKARKVHRQILQWLYYERDRQSENRLEMELDHSFYDGMQWDPEDKSVLEDRGQMALVFNEIAPMVDWVIGTERRTRVDWKVMPRTEDDVDLADVKTKVLKYVSDVNHVQFTRSRAFADAAKGGLGWIDDGVRDDPTQEIIYSKYEDWRCVLHDSSSYELDLSDARYVFRWRWVDLDIAIAMFPEREEQIRRAADDQANWSKFNDLDELTPYGYEDEQVSGQLHSTGAATMIDAKRERVKLYECQYRMPAQSKIAADGPLKGSFVHEQDLSMLQALAGTGSNVIEKVMLRVHYAIFTEGDMLAMGPSIFRHNRFSLTPIWCYRRNKDRMPYGMVRRVRDIQQDMNKRASKALFMLNTNQIIADEGAVDDWNLLRDEADRPDGMIVKKPGKQLEIRRDTDAATGQVQMMTLDQAAIQRSTGISNENLGRQTNATSGTAIQARQLQGSVVTTEPFDNLRFAVQIQGEKQLSLTEQFYSEAKVIRLTGARGAVEWVKVNQPEEQPDGSVRFLNDISASTADFVVSEQDYAGTVRQVMMEQLTQMAGRLPPEVSLRVLRIAMEYSDLPNKDEIADQIRQITGEQDPNKKLTPEEAQQMEQQMQMQAEALQMQRESAALALEEQRAKVAKMNAEAQKIMAEAGSAGQGVPPELEQQMMQIRQQAADQIEQLSQQLTKAQSDLANRTMQIRQDSDVKLEVARIDADTKLRIAEIQKASDQRVEMIQARFDQILAKHDAEKAAIAAKHAEELAAREKAEAEKKSAEAKASEEKAKTAKPAEPAKPAAAPAPAPAQPITMNIQIDAKSGEVKKQIKLERDKDGNLTGAQVDEK
jgi:hypothetical protein